MKIALITSGYEPKNFPLQPWRYLSEIAKGLSAIGHEVRIFTDVSNDDPSVVKLPSINLPKRGNSNLLEALSHFQPDICLWHLGLTSALNFDPKHLTWPTYAIFTSPIYKLSDLLSLGFKRLWQARDYALIHLVGAVLPRYMVKMMLLPLQGVITESAHNAKELEKIGIPKQKIHHIAPGVDDIFRANQTTQPPQKPFTVLYMGSPLPVRGVFDLLEAVAIVIKEHDICLKLLSRGNGEYKEYELGVRKEIARLDLTGKVNLVTGFLTKPELFAQIQNANLIVLPFQIVPSDVPLAVLEAMAMGKAVLATNVDSLPEYLGQDRGFLSLPGKPGELAAAIKASMNSEVNAQMAQNALAYAKNFLSWADVSAEISEVLDQPKNYVKDQSAEKIKNHIYITGVDGVGKTTQMDMLQVKLSKGQRKQRVWLRFPVFFSLPLLAYARMCGFTKYEIIDDVRIGIWQFDKSTILKILFPWFQYIDTFVLSIPKVIIPRLQYKRLLFERFAIDILVDTMVAINDPLLHKKYIGRALLNLVPKNTKIIILDADESTIRSRRKDVQYDPVLGKRLVAYRTIATELNFELVENESSIEDVSNRILKLVMV